MRHDERFVGSGSAVVAVANLDYGDVPVQRLICTESPFADDVPPNDTNLYAHDPSGDLVAVDAIPTDDCLFGPRMVDEEWTEFMLAVADRDDAAYSTAYDVAYEQGF